MAEKTTEEFKALNDISGGNIHIGCAESEGMHLFVQAMKALNRKYPRNHIHFHSSGTEAIEERLDKGLLDMAVIVQPVNLSKYNYLKIPYEDRWGLLMRKDHPLSKKEAVSIEDVTDIPLICSHQGLKDDLLEWFGESKKDLNIVATYDMLFNASLMVREGIGCAVCLDKLI